MSKARESFGENSKHSQVPGDCVQLLLVSQYASIGTDEMLVKREFQRLCLIGCSTTGNQERRGWRSPFSQGFCRSCGQL